MACCIIPFLGNLVVGGSFIAVGVTRAMDPSAVAKLAKASSIYSTAVGKGLPLDKGNTLTSFIAVVSATFALSGLMFLTNTRRKLAVAYISSVIIAYTAAFHLNTKDLAATSCEGKAHAVKNAVIVGALLMIAGTKKVTAQQCPSAAAAKKDDTKQ